MGVVTCAFKIFCFISLILGLILVAAAGLYLNKIEGAGEEGLIQFPRLTFVKAWENCHSGAHTTQDAYMDKEACKFFHIRFAASMLGLIGGFIQIFGVTSCICAPYDKSNGYPCLHIFVAVFSFSILVLVFLDNEKYENVYKANGDVHQAVFVFGAFSLMNVVFGIITAVLEIIFESSCHEGHDHKHHEEDDHHEHRPNRHRRRKES